MRRDLLERPDARVRQGREDEAMSEAVVSCRAKHTKYQPPEDAWRCPVCDATSEDFTIECSADSSSDDCTMLHAGDELFCANCEKYWSGAKAATLMQRKANVDVVKCEACKGHGHITRPKEPKR